jgi:hypothetical protein
VNDNGYEDPEPTSDPEYQMPDVDDTITDGVAETDRPGVEDAGERETRSAAADYAVSIGRVASPKTSRSFCSATLMRMPAAM